MNEALPPKRGGLVTLVDLCKLNSILDMQAASERIAAEKARR